ncbi:MAG TPA: MarR family transcriptional regulator [Tardiphaga sp.]
MQKPASFPDLLSARILRLSNTLALYSARHYRQLFGVSLPEWRVMSIVATRDGITARDISRTLATDKAWVGLSVKSLARRGYLTRVPDKRDSRRVLLHLTPQGKELHDAILAVARKRQRRLLAALPDGVAEALITGLDRLQAEADQMLKELDISES